jgi:hypothetical protein
LWPAAIVEVAIPHFGDIFVSVVIIAKSYLEAVGRIATNAQKLVFLPYEASGVMASLGGIRELLTEVPAQK